MTCDARYVLFLNPDTEIVDGTFGELVADARRAARGRPGRRQPAHRPTARCGRRSAASRARAGLGEAFGSERWPVRPALGRRARARPGASTTARSTCDWTSGSFMLARREALESAGLLDERFFIYSEEPDLCLRIKRAGWDGPPPPAMTIVHHAGKGGRAAEDGRAGRLHAPAVRQQALRAVRSVARTWLRSPRGTSMRAGVPGGDEPARSGARRRDSRCARSPAARRRPSARRRRPRSRARSRTNCSPRRRAQRGLASVAGRTEPCADRVHDRVGPPFRVVVRERRFGFEPIGQWGRRSVLRLRHEAGERPRTGPSV